MSQRAIPDGKEVSNPKKFFRDLPIRFKMLLVYAIVFTVALVLESMIVYSFVRRIVETNIKSELKNSTTLMKHMVEASAGASIRNYLRVISEKNREIVAHMYQQYQAGLMTEEQAKTMASEILLSQTIGKTGYIYCLNSQGVLDVHPEELLSGSNISEYVFIQEQIGSKEGYLEYEWRNPGETSARPKALYMTYFEPWDWIISASSYRTEFTSLVNVDDFRDNILSIRFGQTGYPYVINSKGTLIIHPKLEGNFIDSKDADGRLFIKEICEQKTGEIIYPWQNPDEPSPREKLVYFDYIPELDWIVASSSYLEEFYSPLRTISYIVIVMIPVTLFLILPLTFWVSSTITHPLQILRDRFSLGAAGDLTVRMTTQSNDEVGQLANYFNDFMDKLELSNNTLQAEITERKRVEEELRNYQEQLEERVKERTATLAESEKKLRAMVGALQESEQKMASIISFLPDASLVIDRQGKVIAWNRALEKMTGVNAEEMLGKDNYEHAIPFYGERRPILIDLVLLPREEFEAKYTHIERQGEVVIGEAYIPHLRGGGLYMVGSATALRDMQGNIVGAIEIIRDITARKKAEQALLQAKEEAEDAQIAAEKANLAKSTFLASMSHELRTPLNAILGFSNLMTRDPNLTRDQQENLATIGRSGEHLLGLINAVLDMAKIESGRMDLYPEEFDLYHMLLGIEEMFRLRAEEKHLTLLFERTPDVPQYIRADQNRLRQVLLNLLGNAVKFTKEGGITLRCCRSITSQDGEPGSPEVSTTSLHFEVEDTGLGIAEEEMDHLFEPFVQTQSGRQSREGTGLGLPISRQLVHLMGGEMTAQSHFGYGTIFMFDIVVDIVKASVVEPKHPIRRVIGLEPNQPHYRILVVDDKEANCLLLVKLLSPLGFEVQDARDGQEALDIWERWSPHLIWMDMRMPVMDGEEATQRIKATDKGRETVVIALTASVLESHRNIVLSAGCDDFVRKPFRESEIFETMHKFLGVRYIYEESQEPEEVSAGREVLSPTTIADLPDDLLEGLQQATIDLDMDLIQHHIECIRPQNSALADALTDLANNYEYTRLSTLLEEALGRSQ